MHGPAALTGRAAKGVTHLLRAHGFDVVAEPESFLVTKQDRLEPQEQDRARDWAAKLAAARARLKYLAAIGPEEEGGTAMTHRNGGFAASSKPVSGMSQWTTSL